MTIFKRKKVGKRVGNSMYVHKDYIDMVQLVDRVLIREALAVKDSSKYATYEWNIVKYWPAKDDTISFLFYPGFENDAHPVLRTSIRIGWGCSAMGMSQYDSEYILHRKELLVHNTHPYYDLWKSLTSDEESAGLYGKVHKPHIGRKSYWDALLAEKELQISGHELQTLAGVPYRAWMKHRMAFGG